jgi:putative two-component system response regulator
MKRILVVDDNLLTLKQLEAHLAQHYEVILAKSGNTALQICKCERPDLILLDVLMPEMDGFQVMAALNRNPSLARIPVIFLTGDKDSDTELRGLELGAMDFITKPVNKTILFPRIELHLKFSEYEMHPSDIVRDLEDSMAVSFSELIEFKTDYYGNHGADSGLYVDILGKELIRRKVFSGELNEPELEKIVRAAPFHDIGKIAVRESVLRKKGKLSDEEYAEIKKHPTIGMEVLKKIYKRLPNSHYFMYAQIIAEGHHEAWDGTGYPNGIKGNKIPLCCRIIGLANMYSSCRSPRDYRDAYNHADTVHLIKAEREKLFDPRIVDAFLEVEGEYETLSKKLSKGDKNVATGSAENVVKVAADPVGVKKL